MPVQQHITLRSLSATHACTQKLLQFLIRVVFVCTQQLQLFRLLACFLCYFLAMRGILVALTTALAHAVPQQINLHYTAEAGVLSVDFVAVDSPGNVSLSLSAAGPWTVVPTTSFPVQNIGVMHQARLPFNSTVPGVAGYYKVATASGESVSVGRRQSGGAGGCAVSSVPFAFPPLLPSGAFHGVPHAGARKRRKGCNIWGLWPSQ